MFGNKRDDFYFNSFIAQAQYSAEIIRRTQQMLNEYVHGDITHAIDEIHQIEHAADIKQHEIMEKLTKEFMAPIEREDIVDMAQGLDNLTDSIEDISITIYEYDVPEIRQPAHEFMLLIVQSVEKLQKLLEKFADFKKDRSLMDEIIEINRLEEVGDKIYRESLHQLFKNENEAKVLITWKELYLRMETVLDTVEDLANMVESIVMKNT